MKAAPAAPEVETMVVSMGQRNISSLRSRKGDENGAKETPRVFGL